MSDEESRAARQKALAEKRRRIEELKARRQAAPPSTGETVAGNKGGASLEEYIDELLKTSSPSLSLAPPSSTAEAATPKEEKEVASSKLTGVVALEDSATVDEVFHVASPPSRPSRVETFEIAIQTEEDDFPPPSLADEDEIQLDGGDGDDDHAKAGDDDRRTPLDVARSNSHDSAPFDSRHESTLPRPEPLSQQEKDARLSSPPFVQFLSAASKRVERLLGASDEGMMYGILAGKGWGNLDYTSDYARDASDRWDDEDHQDDDFGIVDGRSGIHGKPKEYSPPRPPTNSSDGRKGGT